MNSKSIEKELPLLAYELSKIDRAIMQAEKTLNNLQTSKNAILSKIEVYEHLMQEEQGNANTRTGNKGEPPSKTDQLSKHGGGGLRKRKEDTSGERTEKSNAFSSAFS